VDITSILVQTTSIPHYQPTMTLAMTEETILGVYDDVMTETPPWVSSFLILGERRDSPQAQVPMKLPLLETIRLEWK
jgi:hypothetical protein